MKKKISVLTLVLSLIAFVIGFTGSATAYNYEGWKFFKCSTCSTTYPVYTWGDRLDDGESLLKDAWRQAITDWHGKQSKVRFTYSSSTTDGYLNSYYESGTSTYGTMYVQWDWLNYVTYFNGELNAGHSKITDSNVARSTANHELGHAMGLDHTTNNSIMDTGRTRSITYVPQTDDVNGINNLY